MRGSTLAFVLASASAFLVQVVKTENPQQRIDKAAEILKFASRSHENGEVRELNHDEVHYKAELTSTSAPSLNATANTAAQTTASPSPAT